MRRVGQRLDSVLSSKSNLHHIQLPKRSEMITGYVRCVWADESRSWEQREDEGIVSFESHVRGWRLTKVQCLESDADDTLIINSQPYLETHSI